ncbi:hypothetical protein ES703_49946 [subsurface metagenome]
MNSQYFLPFLSAVGGLVQSPLRIFRIQMPEGRHIDDVRILGMDDDAADMVGFFKAHILPGFAGVCGLVHSVSPVRASGVVGFSGSDPDNVRI